MNSQSSPTDEVVKVTPEMQEAWVHYDAPKLYVASANSQVIGAVRHAFYAGYLAALSADLPGQMDEQG